MCYLKRDLNRFDLLTFAVAAAIACAELVGDESGGGASAETQPTAASVRDEKRDAPPSAPPLSSSAPLDARPGDACQPLHPDLPEIARIGDDPPIPDLEDEAVAMAPFYEHVAQILRGTATDHVRIAVYGDSNLTRDYMTGAMRRRLQTKYGDAGHGYVASVKPWGWYHHMDVRHGDDGAWDGINVTTRTTYDARYGHAFIAAHSQWQSSRTWVQTADEHAPIGKTASHFDIAYVKGPWYGAFDAEVDGTAVAHIDAHAAEFSAGFTAIDVPDAPHKLVLAVKSGSAQLLGVSIEREPKPASFVVDSLGVGSMNCVCMLQGDPEVYDATLQRRKYDLVIVHLGTNLFIPDKVGPCYEKLIARHRHALPGVPLLVMTPPDFIGMINPPRTADWMLKTIDALKSTARASRTPLFDFFAAMGGNGSMARFHERKMVGPGDWVHFNEEGAAYMGDRVLYAIWKGFQGYAADHPRAGCEPPP